MGSCRDESDRKRPNKNLKRYINSASFILHYNTTLYPFIEISGLLAVCMFAYIVYDRTVARSAISGSLVTAAYKLNAKKGNVECYFHFDSLPQ